MKYFTADLHLGHANILKYCNRPFDTVEEMNAGIVDNWNSVVWDNDTVVILGDLALGKVEESLEIVSELNGHKYLLCGNHDRSWNGHPPKRSKGWKQKYLDAGLQHVDTGDSDLWERVTDDAIVRISHFPFSGGIAPYDDKFAEYAPLDTGQWLLHGHTHGAWRQKGKQIDVGIDAWGGQLVPSPAIMNLLLMGEGNREAIPWAR